MDRRIDLGVYGDWLIVSYIVCLFVIKIKSSPWLYLRGRVWVHVFVILGVCVCMRDCVVFDFFLFSSVMLVRLHCMRNKLNITLSGISESASVRSTLRAILSGDRIAASTCANCNSSKSHNKHGRCTTFSFASLLHEPIKCSHYSLRNDLMLRVA